MGTEETRPADPIEGKVAKVLSTRELVINRGSEHGVEAGMTFRVLAPTEDIVDPDTGESLGGVKREKLEVKTTSVEERFSIARTFKYRRVNIGGSGYSLGRTLQPPRYVRRPQTFKTDEGTEQELSERESIVKVGDPVIQVFEPQPVEFPELTEDEG